METKTLEGTWEEIARLAPELAGRRLRVTILDEPAEPRPLDAALAPLIEEAGRLAGPEPDAPPAGEDWTEAIAEKFRRQGFDL
jgi:hypothetical protein